MAALDIAYLIYDHVDLAQAEKFFLDFGLVVAFRTENEVAFRPAMAKGYCYIARKGASNRLVAIGMTAPDTDDLVRVASFPEAGPVEDIDRPGEGRMVRLESPDGIPFEVTFGIASFAELPVRPHMTLNYGQQKHRFGKWQRADLEPAKVLRLGHVALMTPNFARNAEWLQSRLGVSPSDILFDGVQENAVGGFFHCTGGQEWTDHHTIALFPGNRGVHHCSFEIQDLDTQFLGNKWLRSQGWRQTWGVGRHILGSQIFDYWFDPAGNIVEHFTDGDLIKPGTAPDYHQIGSEGLAQWGPPMPVADFIGAAPTIQEL